MTFAGQEPLLELARAWWMNRVLEGTTPARSIESDYDSAYEIDSEVELMSLSSETLGGLLTALVKTASSPSDVEYVGTYILEMAYAKLGDKVFPILQAAPITTSDREKVLFGFWR